MEIFLSLIFILFTVIIYIGMKLLYIKFYSPFMLPIVTGTTLIIIALVILNIPYNTYMMGGKWIGELLGPAVVALALPLYKQWNTLKKYGFSLIIGVLVGTLVGITSGILLSIIFNIDELTLLSVAPKSVTTPVAMEIAEVIGGSPTLAAVFVMVAGISGAVVGPSLAKWFKIHHFLGKGVGFGAASHGIGTGKALELGEEEGAVSSIAMTLSAVFASFLSPILVSLLL